MARDVARYELNAQRPYTLAWTVITIWECELFKKNLDATRARIEADLHAAKTKYEHYLSIRRVNRELPVYRPNGIKRSKPNSTYLKASATTLRWPKMINKQTFQRFIMLIICILSKISYLILL